MKNKNKWKGRERVLNYLKPHLWRILFKESQANIPYHLEKLTGLTPDELLILKRINFLLSDEVKELLNILPPLMRNLAHSTRKETIECRGMVRGRIDWGLTIKERYSRGYNDPSLFICKPASKMYDLPENQLLKFILSEIVNFGENIEYLPALTEDVLDESEVHDYVETIQSRRSSVRRILKHVQFHNITLPHFVRPKTVQRARNHRNHNYQPVVKCYELYENLFLTNRADALKKLLEKQLLEPLNNDKLYELYILFKVLEKLEQKGGKISLGLLKPGKKPTPYVAQYQGENETINVYYQKMPGGCWKDSEYKDIFKFYNLNVSSRRPDIILEFVKDDSYRLIEVKRTNKRDYIVDSVYKVIGYLSDFKECFPDKKALDGVLVVWKGIKIKDWSGALKMPVLILSERNLDQGLNRILSISEEINEPEEFKVEYYCFGSRSINSMEYEGGKLIVKSSLDSFFKKDQKDFYQEIISKMEEWDIFWKKMEELSIWEWDKRYEIKEEGINVDGDIWKVKISIGGKCIDSSGWCIGPESLDGFFIALKELARLDISSSYHELMNTK